MKTAAGKICRNIRGVSPVISTIIISGTLLIILVVASFASTNLLELQIANTEFEQAKTNMLLLDEVIQDVALRPGSGGFVQFNQRSGGIGITSDQEKTIKITGSNIATVDIKSPNSVPTSYWTNPINAYKSDNKYAYTSTDGAVQQYKNYKFDIPSDATIIRVEIGYEAYVEGNGQIKISCSWNDGANWATEKICALESADSDNVYWVDFSSDTDWTPSKLSDANFRVKIKAVKISGKPTFYLDWIPVRVTYVASESLLHEFPPPLVSITYSGGSKVSGTDLPMRGNNSLNVGMADALGYLRVETGNGVQIKLDYNRVRIVDAGKLVLGNTLHSFIEITFIRLVKGNTGGSDTVNVKVQNIDVNTTTYMYDTPNGKISIQIKSGERSSSDVTFDVASKTVVIVTEVKVQISIG